jgi:hypothetical protein
MSISSGNKSAAAAATALYDTTPNIGALFSRAEMSADRPTDLPTCH